MEDFTVYLQLWPGDADVYYQRGRSFLKLSRFREAINDFSQALRYSPEHHLAKLKRAEALYAADDPTGAVRDLQQLEQETPADWPYRSQVRAALQQLTGSK